MRKIIVINVTAIGKLKLLETFPTGKHAHSGTTDDHGNVYVSDPMRGQLLLIKDTHSATR